MKKIYQYLYEHVSRTATLSIFAYTKKEADSVLKDLGYTNDFNFLERV
jgi:hypothetical protein